MSESLRVSQYTNSILTFSEEIAKDIIKVLLSAWLKDFLEPRFPELFL